MVAQAGDGVAQHLRQRHFDGDVDQQQAEAQPDASRILAQEGKDAQQAAGLELLRGDVIGHEGCIEGVESKI